MTRRTKHLTPEQRLDAVPILEELVSRPSFHVAMLWIKQCGARPARNGYPVSVGSFCFFLELTWGAIVDAQTMAVALETAGYRVGGRTFPGCGRRELAVNIKAGSINQTPWRTESPLPERWAGARDAVPIAGAAGLYANLLH